MMYVHSLGRAARYYPECPAVAGPEGKRSTFRELDDRVVAVAAGLSRHGFRAGDRLAMLLPNETGYLELIYACSRLGVIAVPVNARSSTAEIDLVLADASPRGLIRHSSLLAPTLQLPWELEQIPVRFTRSPHAGRNSGIPVC
jgi:acyl-CoA synthetase (AMP-forming)/AMP-acid ligase II